jgi:tripartite-type tricarboxylate transporter receptor subunit TctC
MKAILRILVAALGLSMTAAQAAYPERPLRMIVPFSAGGPTDGAARIVGQALAKSLGQPVVVENRPGADGAIAAQALMAAPADGYTFLFASSSILAVPLLSTPPAFDPRTDFAPVARVGRLPFALYVHPGVPARDVAELIAHARAHPEALNFSTSNLSEYIAAAQFMQATGVRMVRVPYKGSAQAMPDLIAGRVQVNFGPVSGGLAQAKDGRLRVLAVLLPQRDPLLPDVPTLGESGVAVSVTSWQAIFAPAKTPREIIERVSREVNQALQTAEVRMELEKRSLQVEGSDPAGLAAAVERDQQAWVRFVRDFKVTKD